MMNNDCPKCGGTVYTSRDTSSGEVIIRAICVRCGWEHKQCEGKATWRVMQEQRGSFWATVKGWFKR